MSERCERTDERVAQYLCLGFLLNLAHNARPPQAPLRRDGDRVGRHLLRGKDEEVHLAAAVPHAQEVLDAANASLAGRTAPRALGSHARHGDHRGG